MLVLICRWRLPATDAPLRLAFVVVADRGVRVSGGVVFDAEVVAVS